MADTCKGFKYILADSAYDSNQFRGYIFKKTALMLVIDTNRRRSRYRKAEIIPLAGNWTEKASFNEVRAKARDRENQFNT